MKEIIITSNRPVYQKNDEGEYTVNGDGKRVSLGTRKVDWKTQIPTSVQEWITFIGEEAAEELILATYKIKAQAAMGQFVEQGLSDEEINARMANFKPGSKAAPPDPITAFINYYKSLPAGSPEKQATADKLKELGLGAVLSAMSQKD